MHLGAQRIAIPAKIVPSRTSELRMDWLRISGRCAVSSRRLESSKARRLLASQCEIFLEWYLSLLLSAASSASPRGEFCKRGIFLP